MEDEVIPLGDDVSQRAAIVTLTERNSAVHTPCSLDLEHSLNTVASVLSTCLSSTAGSGLTPQGNARWTWEHS